MDEKEVVKHSSTDKGIKRAGNQDSPTCSSYESPSTSGGTHGNMRDGSMKKGRYDNYVTPNVNSQIKDQREQVLLQQGANNAKFWLNVKKSDCLITNCYQNISPINWNDRLQNQNTSTNYLNNTRNNVNTSVNWNNIFTQNYPPYHSSGNWTKFQLMQDSDTSDQQASSRTANNNDYSPTRPTTPTPPSSPDQCRSDKNNIPTGSDSAQSKQTTFDRDAANAASEISTKLDKVYIWDLDETIIIFKTLLSGEYAEKFGKDKNQAKFIGFRMENLIFYLADEKFHFRDLESSNRVHIDDIDWHDSHINGQDIRLEVLVDFDLRYNILPVYKILIIDDTASSDKMEAKQNVNLPKNETLVAYLKEVKDLYQKHRNNVKELLSSGRSSEWELSREELKSFTENWLALARNCINTINLRANSVNVIVTNTQLVPALVKCLLFSIGDLFPVDNVYSSADIGKEQCFRRIMDRYGDCQYSVMGDGKAEESASYKLNLPFWNISSHNDLFRLQTALSANKF